MLSIVDKLYVAAPNKGPMPKDISYVDMLSIGNKNYLTHFWHKITFFIKAFFIDPFSTAKSIFLEIQKRKALLLACPWLTLGTTLCGA
jgi:hypothetical protein